MNWLILLYFLEFGYSPFYQSANILSDQYEYIRNENVYYVDLDAEIVILDHLFIGGTIKTYIQPNNNEQEFIPIQMNYLIKTGLRLNNIEIGFRHFCMHPVLSIGMDIYNKSYSGYEEFYIRISSEF